LRSLAVTARKPLLYKIKTGALHNPINPRIGAFLVSRKIPGPHQ
jgi:hypothetical protein